MIRLRYVARVGSSGVGSGLAAEHVLAMADPDSATQTAATSGHEAA
jgi:hypothetical protein